MTVRKNLKKLVRARIAKTGESYTTALQHIRSQNVQKVNKESDIAITLKNRFVLEQCIGTDEISQIYRALDLRQQEANVANPYVAIQILNRAVSQQKARVLSLQRRAATARRIHSNHVVAIYDFDRDEDTYFQALELLEGKTLDIYLKEKQGRLSLNEAKTIIVGICEAIKIAHANQVLHASFDPSKIYYTKDKIAKVFDFGAQLDKPSATLYMSPERLLNQKPNVADDVFALAVVIYEILSGHHPFGGLLSSEATTKNVMPARPKELTEHQWQFLSHGLQLDAEKRLSSIEQLESMFS